MDRGWERGTGWPRPDQVGVGEDFEGRCAMPAAEKCEIGAAACDRSGDAACDERPAVG